MSDELEKPARKEPVLQPMKIVDVGPYVPAPAVNTAVTPTDKPKKPLVMGKKHYEQMKAQANKPKAPQSLPLRPESTILEDNSRIINDLDRNAKVLSSNDNQKDLTDYDWIKEVGGRHIRIAWLQTAVSISGFVSSETTFSQQKIRGLSMSWVSDGLLCKIDNSNGVEILLIPAANVKCMSL